MILDISRRKFLLAGSIASATLACAANARAIQNSQQPVNDNSDDAFILPLFPLDIVVFPGQVILLHVFEPRYRQLINDCQSQGFGFGISTILQQQLAAYGTEVRLLEILSKDEDGNIDIALRGTRVYRLQKFIQNMSGKLYSGGFVKLPADDSSVDPDQQNQLITQYQNLQRLDGSDDLPEAHSQIHLSFAIAHSVYLSRFQKLKLLSLNREKDRQQFLSRHLQKILNSGRQKSEHEPN